MSTIKIILGNPPYSVGQKSANDNAENKKYKYLHQRISETYGAASYANNKNSLYNSSLKAFRLASDQVLNSSGGGVVAFISDAGWLNSVAGSGVRACFYHEFDKIYVFDLRGHRRIAVGGNRKAAEKEGENVFGSQSMSQICITFLVKHG